MSTEYQMSENTSADTKRMLSALKAPAAPVMVALTVKATMR